MVTSVFCQACPITIREAPETDEATITRRECAHSEVYDSEYNASAESDDASSPRGSVSSDCERSLSRNNRLLFGARVVVRLDDDGSEVRMGNYGGVCCVFDVSLCVYMYK